MSILGTVLRSQNRSILDRFCGPKRDPFWDPFIPILCTRVPTGSTFWKSARKISEIVKFGPVKFGPLKFGPVKFGKTEMLEFRRKYVLIVTLSMGRQAPA